MRALTATVATSSAGQAAGRASSAAHDLRVALIASVAGLAMIGGAGLAMAAPNDAARTERLANTGLSDAILGQFTPASGDPRLIARYASISAQSRARFSFTPVLDADAKPRDSITVVVRAKPMGAPDGLGAIGAGARRQAGSVTATATPLREMAAPVVAIAPVAYNLGKSVGFDRFKTTSAAPATRRPSILDAPLATARLDADKPSRLTSRLVTDSRDPAGAPAPAFDPDGVSAVGLNSSLRVTRNIDVTAGVRYNRDADRLLPADSRKDGQAVFVGTQFRF